MSTLAYQARGFTRGAETAGAWMLGLLWILPLAYAFWTAFHPGEFSTHFVPTAPLTLENFVKAWHAAPFARYFLNTILLCTMVLAAQLVLCTLAAYAFARFRFKGRRMGMLALLLIQMFPTFLAVVAIYLIVLRIGDVFPSIGLDTRASVILVGLGGALGINTWLMKGFLDSIPDSLDESARVDGATPGQVFWGIILPLATPVLAVVGLLSYIFSINEFIIASRLLQTTDKWTLPVGLYGFISDKYASQWGPFCAGVVLAALPVVILFFFLQRYITEGLTRGAVKG